MAKLRSVKYNVTFEPIEVESFVTAYEAVNDNIRSFVCYGATPSDVLRGMADLLDENHIEWWSGAHVSVLDDEDESVQFYAVVYV
jgi:hypothetical protein